MFQHFISSLIPRVASSGRSLATLSKPPIRQTNILIEGKFVAPTEGRTFPTLNPATEEKIADVAWACPIDVDKAVKSSRAAFDSGPWSRFSGAERGRLLNRVADLIEKNADELAALESLDNGKPAAIARAADLNLVIACYRYYAGWADKNSGQVLDTPAPLFSYTRHVPVGVVGAIIPWNFPLLMQAWKLAPALATGCTVVLKPAEQTPLSALRVGELLLEAGLPPGVVNILPGHGDTGAAISAHPGVDKLAFTGSTEVGKIVMQAASSHVKRVTLELGGKSPFIILPDAPIDQAVQAAHDGLFFNHGQCCCASSRILVHESIFEEFKEKSVRLAKSRVVGDPFHPATQQGPQVDRDQLDKILGLIDSGVKDSGAKLLTGGKRFGNKGYFVEPTVFATDHSDSARIVQEEIFGPVICLMPFKTVDEAIQRANNSIYGLAAGVFTRDFQQATKIAHRLRAGTVWINTWNAFDANVPFGGFKESGIGRELGEYALRNFTEVQSITTNLSAY